MSTSYDYTRRRFSLRLARTAVLGLTPGAFTLGASLGGALLPLVASAQSPVLSRTDVERLAGNGRSPEQIAAHLLNRLGFGPRPGDLARVAADPAAWIESQLQPAALPLPLALASRPGEAVFLESHPLLHVRRLRELQRTPLPAPAEPAATSAESSTQAMPGQQTPSPVLRNPAAAFVNTVAWPAIEGRLLRALESPRQLEEVMVDFWFNHFNVFQGKNVLRVMTGHYEHFAIRPFALGRFRDLLGATARHPAMLYYLDNTLSVAPGTGRSPENRRGLNENYARELMELHTLGVDGGYTQQDVTELARMLTGWMIQPVNGPGGFTPTAPAGFSSNMPAPGLVRDMPGFWFNDRVHDQGEKLWLGQRVLPQGQAEGEFALDFLARHPATARHIAFKLARYFVADQPDPALVAKLAKVFQDTDGAIVPVLRSLFASSEFWSPKNQGNKFKTPYHYALSVVRASGQTPARLQPLAAALSAQGMPIYGCQTPDGYKNTEEAWLNPDAISKRINFASAVSAGRMGNPAEGMSPATLRDSLPATLGPLVDDNTLKLSREPATQPALAAALMLAGPGMMRR